VTSTDDLVEIGRVGRPHGLDGAFVVERPSDARDRFAVGATVWAAGSPAKIVLARRVGGGRLAIKLDAAVERGQVLAVRRADLPEPSPDHYYVFQLVGLEAVETDGAPLGHVRDVLAGAANDNLELEDGRLVPLIEDAIAAVDLQGGRIVLNPGFIL
jgi:16S rRNA processing protein RimM